MAVAVVSSSADLSAAAGPAAALLPPPRWECARRARRARRSCGEEGSRPLRRPIYPSTLWAALAPAPSPTQRRPLTDPSPAPGHKSAHTRGQRRRHVLSVHTCTQRGHTLNAASHRGATEHGTHTGARTHLHGTGHAHGNLPQAWTRMHKGVRPSAPTSTQSLTDLNLDTHEHDPSLRPDKCFCVYITIVRQKQAHVSRLGHLEMCTHTHPWSSTQGRSSWA